MGQTIDVGPAPNATVGTGTASDELSACRDQGEERRRFATAVGAFEQLQHEGYSPADIEAIFILLAHRLRTTGQAPPSEGLYDYGELAELPAPA